MFHGELFSSSIATGANTLAQLTYVSAGAILPVSASGMQVSPEVPYLMAVAGVGAHLVHVQPRSTSMQPFPYPHLSPNNRGAAFESPARFWDFSTHPMPLRPTEEFDIYATQNAAGSETEYVLCLFSDGHPGVIPHAINPAGIERNPASPGRYFSAHWTASTTLTASAFTSFSPTFDTALYAGYYALLGCRVYSATGLFFRLIPSMGPLWRPGGICVQAYDQLDPAGQRGFNATTPPFTGGANWGPWLYFYQNVPPKVEVYATSADTAEEGWFDLVYLGPQVVQA